MGLGSWLFSGQPLDVVFCHYVGREGIALVLCAELPRLGIRQSCSYQHGGWRAALAGSSVSCALILRVSLG